MKVMEVKNFIRCGNCNSEAVKSIKMEFGEIHLCNKCTNDLHNTMKGLV